MAFIGWPLVMVLPDQTRSPSNPASCILCPHSDQENIPRKPHKPEMKATMLAPTIGIQSHASSGPHSYLIYIKEHVENVLPVSLLVQPL